MGRNTRTRTPRGRRIALSCGTAVGAALIAATISMGNAPAARADVIGADQVSDLIGAIDPHAVAAAGVSDTLALSYLIEAFDPEAFGSTGLPTDPLGELGYYTDTYFLGPTGLDAELAPLVQELVGTISSVPPRLNRTRSVPWSGHLTRTRSAPRAHRLTRLAFWPTTPTTTCWRPPALTT